VQDLGPMASFRTAGMPGAGMTAVVILRDREYALLLVRDTAVMSFQVAATGLLTTPLSTT